VVVALISVGIWWSWLGFGEEVDHILAVTQQFHTKVLTSDNFEGYLRCDDVALTCLMGNLFYNPNFGWELYVSDPGLYANLTGTFMQPGIGSPSDYHYLDTWSFFNISNEQHVKIALDRIERERSFTPDRKFIPIYLKPTILLDFQEFLTVEEITIIFSLLWPRNFFRTLYAGAVALFSLYEWNAVAPSAISKIQIVLLDSQLPSNGYHQTLYQAFYPKGRPLSLDELGITRFKMAVFGLSRRGVLQEVDFQFPDGIAFGMRSAAYRYYSDVTQRYFFDQKAMRETVKPLKGNSTISENLYRNALLGVQGSAISTRVVIVVRNDRQRQISNLPLVLSLFRKYPVNIEIVAFEDYTIPQQLEIVRRADVLIAVHGAALSHILFLRSGSRVVELFPYGFKKSIYRNLSNILGVQYAFWQCPRPSCSKFNNPIQNDELAVNWTSQQSKDYWRNQDITVDLVEFEKILQLVLFTFNHQSKSPSTGRASMTRSKGEHYLMYLPWEQLNNQLVGLKAACAVASFLNRTLVIPPIGYRRPLDSPLETRLASTVRVFQPREYEWRQFTKYFDSSIYRDLPCKTVPFEAFVSLTKRVGVLLMRRLGQSARVNMRQLTDFYHHVANLEYEKSALLPSWVPLYLDRQDVDLHLKKRYEKDTVLCLGTMFWIYSFGEPLDFPMRRWQSKMVDPLYREITASLKYHPDLVDLSIILGDFIGSKWNAIHLRRGDYGQKCYDEGMGASQEEHILRSCFQTPNYLVQRIRRMQRTQGTQSIPWFLATNDHTIEKLRRILKEKLKINLITMPDLIIKAPSDQTLQLARLDPTELSILDQLLCTSADQFIGNFFSSFTRTIADLRELRNKTSSFF
jgi:hypothetical protein